MKPIFTFPPPRRRLNNLSTQNPKNLSRQTEPPHSGILLRIDISDVERECRGCSPGQSDPFWMTWQKEGRFFRFGSRQVAGPLGGSRVLLAKEDLPDGPSARSSQFSPGLGPETRFGLYRQLTDEPLNRPPGSTRRRFG